MRQGFPGLGSRKVSREAGNFVQQNSPSQSRGCGFFEIWVALENYMWQLSCGSNSGISVCCKNTIWLKYKVRSLLEITWMHFGSVMVIPRRHDFSICRKDILGQLSSTAVYISQTFRSGIFALHRELWSYYVINLTMLKPSSFLCPCSWCSCWNEGRWNDKVSERVTAGLLFYNRAKYKGQLF